MEYNRRLLYIKLKNTDLLSPSKFGMNKVGRSWFGDNRPRLYTNNKTQTCLPHKNLEETRLLDVDLHLGMLEGVGSTPCGNPNWVVTGMTQSTTCIGGCAG